MSKFDNEDWNDGDFKVLSQQPGNDSSQLNKTDKCLPGQGSAVDADSHSELGVHSGLKSDRLRGRRKLLIAVLPVFLLAIVSYFYYRTYKSERELNAFKAVAVIPEDSVKYSESNEGLFNSVSDSEKQVTPYSEAKEFKFGRVSMLVVTPNGGTPELVIGDIKEGDYILGTQAADIRADNEQISGAFVYRGELLGKGKPRTGFCAIIGGKIIIGMADTTPYLEEALDKDGYFFRQFPFVIAGELIDQSHRPGNRSYRKALVEMENGFSIVISQNQVSMTEFGEALKELGVVNAISLCGGMSMSFYKASDGQHYHLGKKWKQFENVNYIVWR